MRALDRRRLIFVVAVSGMVLAACTGGSSTGGGPTSAPSGDPGTAVGPTAAPSAAPSVAPSSAPVATPSPSATPTPAAGGGTGGATTAPPKPSHTTYVLVKETVSSDQITITERYRATWTEPAGVASGFRVYGVTDCVRYSKKYDDTPCVVPGMQIPLSKRELLATAPGDARAVDVTWTRADEEGPDPYWAILISAVNSHGESRSAILTSAPVCYECVY